MSNWKIKLSLFLNYFVFAILLNSVGTVILQVINHYAVTKSQAGNLDAYKDITIAVFSFMAASYLPHIGYKRSMLIGLALVGIICFTVPFLNTFWAIKLMLVSTGVGFALVKVSTYSTIGLITSNEQQHASFTSTLEGIFMLGVLSGYWIFGFFISSSQSSWLDAFWVLSGLTCFAFILLLFTPLDESSIINKDKQFLQDFLHMLGLLKYACMFIFIISIFAYVFIEQGISTWLPTFNHKTLGLSAAMSVEMTSILSAAYAIGRLISGLILKKVNWLWLLYASLLGAALAIALLLPKPTSEQQIITSWHDAPWRAFVFPFIGFLLAPIYPTLCSTILSTFPKKNHSAVMGLIMIFSALGGTVGSKLTGVVFGLAGGAHALSLSLIPLLILLFLIFPYHRTRLSTALHLKQIS